MSSYTKDPLEKQDTDSESSESRSDSDIDEAEENMEQLNIGERQTKEATKDVSGESKPLDFASQEGPSTSKREPIAGPSGLQTSHLGISGGIADPEAKVASLTDPEKDVETKIAETELQESLSTSEENVESKSISLESNPNYSSKCVQSSTGITDSRILDKVSSSTKPLKPRDVHRVNPLWYLNPKHSFKSSDSKRYAYATDSANTSSDVSEIRSEIADISAGGSLYLEAQENFEKEQSPSYASALSRQASEASEDNISELQEDPPSNPSLSESSSISSSIPTFEEGHQAYLARIKMEAEEREVQVSTSSGIGSTDQSELLHRQAWQAAGERGFYRNDTDDPNQDVQIQGTEPQPTSEPMEDAPISEDKQMQDYDKFFEQEKNVAGQAASKMHQETCPQVRSEVSGSPSKRRSKGLSDFSKSEKGMSVRLRSRSKPDTEKMKMVASKSSPDMQSSSESTEPKSSSSDDSHRKESRGIKSSNKNKEFTKPMGRESWQTRGRLPGMKHPTISSRESSIPEDDERESPLREQAPELMETQDSTSEKMETTSDKGREKTVESSEPSVSKPSVESSDQAYGTEAEGTSREIGEYFEVLDYARSQRGNLAGKSKREPKLSNSPPSDEKVGSSPPKAATSRPKKKARSDKVPVRMRRTRHDTPDTSENSGSDSEKETAL